MGYSDRNGGFRPLDIAVIGSGISGLSAAWLLSRRHRVTLFEAANRIGGHSNTVLFDTAKGPVAVDTGFIVYNEATYPNLTALFAKLNVPTVASDMSFSVSIDGGAYEYAGSDAMGLFARRANLISPRFWAMMRDILRFYRNAPRDLARLEDISLDDYLARNGYGKAFRDDHLYPMAAAIWSTPAMEAGAYPAASFVRFCLNHGLLRISSRPVWRTVAGGSREYIRRIVDGFAGRILTSTPVAQVRRLAGGIEILDRIGRIHRFDDVVIATHADQALAMLADPSTDERRLLGAFRYCRNEAVLHHDTRLMPRRRAAWSSWNYLAGSRDPSQGPAVTYWMNRLQDLGDAPPTFVTLNPGEEPRPETVLHREVYAHPRFDLEASRAQRDLWSLQGQRRTWYCGAHFGAGFHEDGLQAGLAVAEHLGGERRPWQVADESGRIFLGSAPRPFGAEAAA